ncbi:pneumococcal serine-rich repeat protein-like isoform X2 [Eriocheir sinensis]|uniref:pneumococcal serine-rich repeat protein-like isoform X2 n=1 Tax=Eriocheir sinensis TaxID=95602 RepID=UPI0021C647BD|nr:pneumococcal serine-rich repeat protein-like isoform X2 [Eriocheir sinensis]
MAGTHPRQASVRLPLVVTFITLLSSHLVNSEDAGRATEVRVGLGQQAVLPCTADAVRVGGAHHVTHIVFSFVTRRGTAPIYRVNNQGGRVTHWAARGYERRALVHWRPGSSLARLVLEKAVLADEGIYGCHVYTTTSSSHTTSTVSLSVFAPPTSLRIYSDLDPGNEVTGEVGPYDLEEVVTFSCRVTEGHPRPTVTWYEGSRILQDTHVTHTDLTHSATTRSDVTVGPLTREDLYRNLTCRASTSDLFEPLEASVTLDLRYPPNSVRIAGEWEGQLTVRAGAARKVACLVAGGRPTPTITMSLGTDPLPSSPEEEVEGSGTVSVTASRTEITPKEEQDGGILTCSAHTPPFQHITTSVRLVVLYPPRVRIRHGLNLPKEIKEGDDFLFYCEVTANPKVEEVTWTLNGETVQNDPSQGIDAHGLELYLEGVSRSSSGEYRCSAKNSEGEAVSEPYYLKVRGKPEAVTSCSVATSSPSEAKTVTMEVRCVAKADGDLSKIFYLKVKRKGQQKAEKGQHRQVKPVFTVKGLKPGDYDLIVTATNDLGNSPPYTFTHTIHDPTSLPPPSTSTSASPPSSSSSDSAFESASNLSSQSNSSPSSSSSPSSASASASVSVSPSVTNSVSVTAYTTATATSAAASISPTPSLFSFSLSTSFSSPMLPESTDSFDFKAPSLRSSSSSSSSTSSFPASSPPVRSPWKNPWAVVILVIVALTAAGQVGCLIPQLLGTFFVIKLDQPPPRRRRPASPRFVRRRNNSANRKHFSGGP